MKISDISNLNQYATMMAKQTIKAQPQNTAAKTDSSTSTPQTDRYTPSESKMSLTDLTELINSNMTLDQA